MHPNGLRFRVKGSLQVSHYDLLGLILNPLTPPNIKYSQYIIEGVFII